MATAPPIPEIVLPPQQLLLPPKDTGRFSGFVIGETDRPQDERTVAVTIGVRANFRVNDREFSGAICLHEVLALRKFYEEQNGSVTLEAGWPAGVPRHRHLTQAQLMAEVTRMSRDYVIPKENGKIDIMAIYYGAEPSVRLRKIHEIMRKQAEAWAALVPVIMARAKPSEGHALLVWNNLHDEVKRSQAYDGISTQELNRIVNLADPALDVMENLVLESIPLSAALGVGSPTEPPVDVDQSAIQAEAEAAADAAQTPVERLVDALAAGGLSASDALAVASLVEMVGAGAKLTDSDISAALSAPTKAQITLAKTVLSKHKG